MSLRISVLATFHYALYESNNTLISYALIHFVLKYSFSIMHLHICKNIKEIINTDDYLLLKMKDKGVPR